MNVRTKLIGIIVLGAALLVPVAQAQRPDDQAGLRGPGAIESAQASTATRPDDRADRTFPAAESGHAPVDAPVRPDDRAGVRWPTAVGSPEPLAATHPDNRADRRGPGAVTTFLVQPGSSGFDRGDGLIGGLGGAGLALLLTGSAFLFMNRRHKARTA
ncbi:MAG: hypothetical protein ACRDSF_18020 [Pseudonocardiaceae bacterium]